MSDKAVEKRLKHLQRYSAKIEAKLALQLPELGKDAIRVYCKGKRTPHVSGRPKTVTWFEKDFEMFEANLSAICFDEAAQNYVDPDLLKKIDNRDLVRDPLEEKDQIRLLLSILGTELEVPYWYPTRPPAKNLDQAHAMSQADRSSPLDAINGYFLYYKFAQCPECKRLYGFDLVGLTPFFDQLLERKERKISAERLAEMETVPPLDYMGSLPRGEYKLPTLAEMFKDIPIKERQRLVAWVRTKKFYMI